MEDKTKYTKDKDKEIRINLLMSNDLKERYKSFCAENGYNMSGRIRGFIEKELKGEV